MTLRKHPELGRVVRDEPWGELAKSTYGKIATAIERAAWNDAIAHLAYFHDEALVCRRLYDQWLRDTVRYFDAQGLTPDEIAHVHLTTCELITPVGADPWDRDEGWKHYQELRERLLYELQERRSNTTVLLAMLKDTKEAWRKSHDLDVDIFLGLFEEVIVRFGEAAIGDMWEDHLLGEWFAKRYARFDVSKVEWSKSFELLTFLSFEAMHGHLCGPNREGDVEFHEYDDRVELLFDPCGSGGRSYRGEPLDGTGPRMEAPYEFRALSEAHDFTWNKKGICTYCAHCCVLTEKMPAQAFGYPVRVIDPPSYPHEADSKCKYTIYKDLRAIPAEIYGRLGLSKPAADQPLGSKHGPFA